MSTRKRALPGLTWSASSSRRIDGDISYNDAPYPTYNVAGTQVTVSESHKGPYKGPSDNGGPFYTTKSYIENIAGAKLRFSRKGFRPNGASYTVSVDTDVMIALPGSSTTPWPSGIASSNAKLDAFGASAIAKCAPGNSPANIATAVGELVRDGLPHLIGHTLWRDRTRDAKKLQKAVDQGRYRRALKLRDGSNPLGHSKDLKENVGSEYLNVQFAIRPLVKDITSLANAVSRSDEILSQAERDSGKIVRRKYYFPKETKQESTTILGFNPLIARPGGVSSSPGTLVRTREISVERWFSGAFTYYLPSNYYSRNAVVRAASKANYLLGLELTPDTIWELTPWSWAADWFTNSGDVLKNLRRFGTGGLIMQYGYLMETSIIKDTYVLTGATYMGAPLVVPPLVLVTETKQRRPANPFGFGLTDSTLSTYQKSILVALGMSRGR